MSSDEPLRHPKAFPDASTTVLLRGPKGTIEAIADVPDPEQDAGVVAIICHSRDSEGGTMHGKVVHLIERALREMGARTLRFNFRGTGDSDGSYDEGFGETEDLMSVAAWLEKVRPGDELWLGGYGFGCFVTARAAQALPVKHLISVAPPVEDYDFSALERPDCHWLVIQGDEDEVVNPDAVYTWAEALDPPAQLIRMEETDHFFHRRLMDLRGVIKNGVRRSERSADEG